MGPLYATVEMSDSIREHSKENPTVDNVDIAHMCQLVEKTVCCVGQASLAVDRHRRVNTLLKMTEDYKKAKELLDKNEDVISQSGNCLFGEGFKKVLKKSSKTWEEASKIAFSIKKGRKRERWFQEKETRGYHHMNYNYDHESSYGSNGTTHRHANPRRERVQGYKLEFYTLPLQRQPPQYPMFNREQKDSLNQEIQKLLEKGAIQPVHQEQTQFLSYDILLMADSKEKLKEARDCTIFLLINLGFVINWEKSKPNPSQQVEFLGFQIDSQEMLFTLPQEKVVKIKQECHQVLNLQWVTVRQLAKITGKLVSTMQAIIPANLQCRYLQLLQIKSLVEGKSSETKIQLSKGPKKNWDDG
ncbi:unnamed protein product [Mytilus coruscus]|uniref:Reverse transcriptase domain-containing protein n=1 Tax=Mytilus coruscus TaxID=42192 RepID=A0A6J8ERZ5_MYTCO|nr:unnamed protein product [Mytilus coruscus]